MKKFITIFVMTSLMLFSFPLKSYSSVSESNATTTILLHPCTIGALAAFAAAIEADVPPKKAENIARASLNACLEAAFPPSN